MSRVKLAELIRRTSRNMAKGTQERVRQKALELVERAYEEGINVQITEGFRSNERQAELYAQGRTAPGDIVTNAKPGESNHNTGNAVDFVLLSQDGSKALWNVNHDWRRVATIGKTLGFEWGGDWSSFKDYPHLEMKNPGTSNQPTSSKGGDRVGKIKEDGYLGENTIKRLQEFMGTPEDGKISEPSTVIKALQRFLNKYGN